jgi:2'-5' RNA ligase
VLLVELGSEEAVGRLAERVGDRLRSIGVSPVPRDGLHITVCEFGFVDRLDFDLGTVAAQTRGALGGIRRCSTAVVGAGSFPTAAVLRIAPWDGLRRIRGAVVQGVDALTEQRRHVAAEDGGYAPHVTVAYYEEAVPIGRIAEALEPFRTIDPIAIDVRDVCLASVRPPQGASFAWDVIDRLDLT